MIHRPPRGLSPDEAALWRQVAATVTPLHPDAAPSPPVAAPAPASPTAKRPRGRVPPAPPPAPPAPPAPRHLSRDGLDGTWDKRLARGAVVPDLTIDLHGLTLDAAHARINHAIAQALAGGARVILLIAGKPRAPTEHALRGERRGAIRAKLLDWLAHSAHADRIAAVRPASPRHGGAGAVYIVLRRGR